MADRDRWADWLVWGRARGSDERQVDEMNRALARVRRRVLAGARLRVGMDVLDVGAGTGLLALEAARRVGASGSVVAVDVSTDALRETRVSGNQIGLIVGDAVSLPVADESVDALVMRSVLIYVIDKARAAAEFRRVLRPGGRVSIFDRSTGTLSSSRTLTSTTLNRPAAQSCSIGSRRAIPVEQ